MRPSYLFTSLIILLSFHSNAAETKSLGDLFTNNASKVCNTNGNKGTLGCPVNQGAGIVDVMSAPQGGGNPINVLTGNKFEQATDIQAVGNDYALGLNRYYNSRSAQRGMLGIGWRHDYEMQLQDTDSTIDIIQADGRQIHFQKTAAAMGGSSLFITRYKADKSELGYIERSQSSDPSKATWLWTLPTGKQFEFVIHKQVNTVNQLGLQRYGQLSRVTEQADNPSSPYWSLTYGTDGELAQVRNHNGDTLKFAYETTKSGLPKISVTSSKQNKASTGTKDSNGRWVYILDQKGNLAQVVSPTGVRTGYQYNDPFDKHNLTAKFSYDKTKPQLITEWTYDAYDRAISSTHKDSVEKVSVVYDNDTVIPTQAGHIFTNTLTNSVGESTDYRYQYRNDEAQLLSVTGAGCVTCGPSNVSYEYDSAGRVTKTSQLDRQGQTVLSMNTEFDAYGRVKTERSRIADELSNNQPSAMHYEYVSNNPNDTGFSLIAKQWQASVAAGKQTGISYVYNNNGLVTEKVEFGHTPDGTAISRTQLMTYDDQGNLSQVALRDDNDPNSTYIVIEAYTWFEDGSIKTTEQPNLNVKTTFTHNDAGLTTQIDRQIGSENTTIKFGFDNNNLSISMSRYLNDELVNGVKYKRNHTGDITSVTDLEDNFIASYAYDDAGRAIGELNSNGALFSRLDTEGRSIVDYGVSANGVDKLSYRYDDQSRIIGVGRDDTQLVAVNYSDDNKAAQILGASGEQTLLNIEYTQTNDYKTSNNWDALGVKATTVKLVKPGVTQVNQNEQTTTDYGIDDFGRIAYTDSQTAGRNNYQYDTRDQLTGVDLANGVKISYKYDDKGRQINKSVTQEGKVVQQVIWEFDAQDQLVAANGSNQQITYRYDKQGRVIQKRLSLANLATPLVTSYDYDKDGSMTGITLPDGIEILSNKDQIRYKAPDDIKAKAIYSQSTHQAAGLNQISYQLGQHIVMGHYYDDQNRFSGLSYRNMPKSGGNSLIRSAQADDTTPLFSQQWQRTSDDIVEQVTELDYQAKPTEHNYLYDSQYHLVSSTYQPIDLDNTLSKEVTATTESNKTDQIQAQARYIYDSLGNRILGDEQTQTPKYYQYDDQGRLTTINTLGQTDTDSIINSKSISYNPAGQPTHYGDYQLSYSAGQLSQVKGKDGQLIAQYTYNDEGQRIKKIVYQKDDKQLPNPETNYYVYEDSQLQHELDGQGNIIRHYLYIGNTLTATMDYPKGKHGKLLLTAEQPNISLWQRTSNWVSKLWTQNTAYPTINYVITDYLGRPRQVRDGETNVLKWQLTPTLFGGDVDTELQQQSDYQLNMRFPGQYEDGETGLYYNHWRYYDQDTGRYLSADPLGLGGGENLYAYVNATPTHFIDPPGLLLFAFDGTGNQDYGAGTSLSNVVKFRDAYKADPNEPRMFDGAITKLTGQNKAFGAFAKNNAFYIAGVGKTDQYTGVSGAPADAGTGFSMSRRSNTMVLYLQDYLQKVADQYKGNKTKIININLDIVGFSRGAATARMFANKVEELMNGENDPYTPFPSKWRETTKWLKDSCNVNFKFNFMGLWDTVPSFDSNATNGVNFYDDGVELELEVSSKWKRVVHAVAVNEHRAGFHGRSIFNNQAEANAGSSKNRIERGFLGAHSDIGGGYPEGDLSDVALMWVVKEAGLAGVKLDVPSKYNYVQNPTVHDSIGAIPAGSAYEPNRDFLWANQGKKGSKQEQFNSFSHLKLNWKDTIKYENLGYKRKYGSKFEIIYDLSKNLDKGKYMALKKNKTILYDGKSDNTRISIREYIEWVNKNYGTHLTTNANF